MRGRTWFLIGMTVGLSALTVTCRSGRPKCGYNLVPTVVAAVDMQAGTVVTFDHISQRSVPEQFITSSLLRPDDASFVIGRPVQNAVEAGDPLRWSDFGQPRELLKPKARLVTIDVEPSRALHGELRAKDHIDVLTSLTEPETNERVVRTLLENVIVVAVNERLAPQMTSVQLLVTAEEAQELLLAQALGRFSLSLRSPEDVDVLARPFRTTVASLLNGPQHRPNCVRLEMIRGTK